MKNVFEKIELPPSPPDMANSCRCVFAVAPSNPVIVIKVDEARVAFDSKVTVIVLFALTIGDDCEIDFVGKVGVAVFKCKFVVSIKVINLMKLRCE